jgi:hypothetical protein
MTASPEPVFSPPSTNFEMVLEVACTVPGIGDSSDVTMYITRNGDMPTLSSEVYVKPLRLKETTELRAVAVRQGIQPGRVACELYVRGTTKVVPRPVVNPPGGIYGGGIPPVRIECGLERVMITYTLDGSEPTMASELWSGRPLMLPDPVVLNAKAFRNDWVPSVTVTESFDFETLPEPIASAPSGTVFSDTLRVSLQVPGFRDRQGLAIHYTIDGSEPDRYSPVFHQDSTLCLTRRTILKAFARLKGYHDGPRVTIEYFEMVKVTRAWYEDTDGDRRIDAAVMCFGKPLRASPGLIEFTDPYSFGKRNSSGRFYTRAGLKKKQCIRCVIEPPFGPGGNFPSGHYGRIPLPGEFDTAPFLMHDSTRVHVEFPLTKLAVEKMFLNALPFDRQNIAVLNNPFGPGESMLPSIIQQLCDFRIGAGTAVLIKPDHPSVGAAIIHDATGTIIIQRRPLIEEPETGILIMVWDGRDLKNKVVAPGDYRAVISTQERQGRETMTRDVTITVR